MGINDYDGQSRLTREELLRRGGGVAAAIAISGGLAACGGTTGSSSGGSAGGKPRRGGVLTVAITDTEASEKLDPVTPAVSSQYVLIGLIYNTLTNANYLDWQVSPELAHSWDANQDFTQYQFKLRDGVTFHNGKPLTAEDVVWSLRRNLDSKLGSSAYPRAVMSMTPTGIKALDKLTVLIQLTRPDSLLPMLFARPQFSIVPAGTSQFTVATSIGTGPFRLDSWQPATSWSVSRSGSYWEPGLPYLDGVREVVNTDSAARVQGVVSGEFDLAEEIDFSSAKQLEGRRDLQLLPFKKGINRVIVMDCSKRPFSDIRVRNAFKMAMNRQLAVDLVYDRFAVPTTDIPVPPDDIYYPPSLGVRAYDPAQAKSLLAKAGYKDGLSLPMYTSTVFSAMPELAQAYAQSAAAAGIHVNISQWAPATYYDQVWLSKPFYTTYWQTNFPPDNLWFVYGPHGVYNEAKLVIPEFTTLFQKILATGDRSKQVSYTQTALQLAADEWGHIIPANTESPWLAQTKLHGVVGDPPLFRVRLTGAYLDA